MYVHASAHSNKVKSLLCTNSIYSVSSMYEVEFGFGFGCLYFRIVSRLGEAVTPTAKLGFDLPDLTQHQNSHNDKNLRLCKRSSSEFIHKSLFRPHI